MRKRELFIFFLILILVFAIIPIPFVRAAWLSGWLYRKSHTITGSTGGAQTDYQMGIKVYYGAGVDGTEVVNGVTFGKVYINSKCRTDFGDIRFTETDETTLLDYWMISKIDSNNALFWVEVDAIPDNPETDIIYIYYGKDDATTTSDGDATFIFFDDFENQNFNKWTSSGSWEIVSDRVKQGSYSAYCSGDAVDRVLQKSITLNYGVLIHVWAQPDVVAAIYPIMGTELGSSNGIYYIVFRGTGTIQYYHGSYVNWPANSGYSADTWYELELGIKSYGVNGKVKGWKSGAYMGEINNKDSTGSWVASLSEVKVLPGSGSGRNLWIDVYFLRKYVDPEPTHTAWGSEESDITPPSDPNLFFGAGFNASYPYVELYWNHSLLDVQFFEIQNSSDSLSWGYLGQSTTTNYTDNQVVNGTERYYKVRACNYTDGDWYNSSFSDINFEKVYFIPEGDVVCEFHIFNASSIDVIVGTLNDGNLASTYHVDGDWYNVSETAGSPALDIRFNFTDLVSFTCGCIQIYQTYTGHSQHDIDVQIWNFTSTSWKTIGKILYNETADWVCIGLGHDPSHYYNNGNMFARFYHADTGHIAHELSVDRIDLRIIYGEECPLIIAVGNSLWIIMLIFLLLVGSMLIYGVSRKR